MNDILLRFLQSDGVNSAYIVKELYGAVNKANTAKFHNKLNNIQGRKFSDEEIERLEEIRKEFIKNLL